MVLVDANVLLEILLPGRKRVKNAKAYLATQTDLAITMLSVHLLFHFCRQAKVNDHLINNLIDELYVMDLVAEDYRWAKGYEIGKDFEDALQLAVAIRNKCSVFVTFDKPLYEAYKTLPDTNIRLL